MTYEQISRQYGITIRVGARIQHRDTGCTGEVVGPRPKARKFVRVKYDHKREPIVTDPRRLLYLDLPISAQLPEIGGEAA
jgi:hypothetical protein